MRLNIEVGTMVPRVVGAVVEKDRLSAVIHHALHKERAVLGPTRLVVLFDFGESRDGFTYFKATFTSSGQTGSESALPASVTLDSTP